MNPIFDMSSITYLLRQAQEQLKHASDAPALDAERLLLHVVRQPEASWLYAHSEKKLDQAQHTAFNALVAERQTGKPLAYILGWQEFYGRRFIVTPDVLVPRPSTEALIDRALETIKKIAQNNQRRLVIADIGTGSGCIAITLVCELANFQCSMFNVQIIATDISETALNVAKENAAVHGVADKIEFLRGNLLEPLAGYTVDLIVSNPPYVPAAELSHVRRRVRDESKTSGLRFEPRQALDGGTTGDHYTKQILASPFRAIVETTHGEIVKNF